MRTSINAFIRSSSKMAQQKLSREDVLGALGLADSDSDTGGMPPDEEEDLDRQLDPNATRSRQVFEFFIRQYSHVEFTYDAIACCASLGMLISLVFQIKYTFKYVKYTYNICNVFLKQKL